jgi:hypothetical protein
LLHQKVTPIVKVSHGHTKGQLNHGLWFPWKKAWPRVFLKHEKWKFLRLASVVSGLTSKKKAHYPNFRYRWRRSPWGGGLGIATFLKWRVKDGHLRNHTTLRVYPKLMYKIRHLQRCSVCDLPAKIICHIQVQLCTLLQLPPPMKVKLGTANKKVWGLLIAKQSTWMNHFDGCK